MPELNKLVRDEGVARTRAETAWHERSPTVDIGEWTPALKWQLLLYGSVATPGDADVVK